nr:ABC transporter permease [uncultured Leptotrichia sp.]
MIKKVMSLISIFFAISVITFFLVKLSPGDPAENYLRASHVSITAETLRETRKNLGLNNPLPVQYFNWLGNLLKGNFGTSYTQKTPVIDLVTEAFVPTFQLGIFSFIILIITAPFLGILSAIKQNTIFDCVIQILSYICVSIPTFWLGYILIIVFSVSLGILPVSGRGDWENLVLPCATLVTPLIAQTTFFIRKNILEEMESSHVENAIIRGVSRKDVIINHLLRNTSIPIITVLSSNIMYLLTGSVIIEEIFAWPGIGKLFVTAVRNGDFPLIQILLLFFGIVSVIVNEFTQVLVKFMDPRLKIKGKTKKKSEHGGAF